MTAEEDFTRYLAECPLIAIIRGVTPDEVVAIGEAILAGGIRIIEVPLNSPHPFESIDRLAKAIGDRALVGAGTVLDTLSVARVKDAGGRLIVAPNTNAQVISAAVQAEMVAAPGYFTPTEAFVALDAGAQALKLFPAEGATPAILKAQRAVLPRKVPVLVVGGVQPDNMRPWLDAGANGFGLGSGLYAPGRSADDVHARAKAYVAGCQA
ncbi:2-dehydro-3-deoxy-6-phosphogalactonate aldolase [Sphingomonas glaciei]|uniref:2-dehydro-3-deoxy-6-phosphogalactonate aldolase n=1 Tax=Sphingomonas glaciei TaxID=2938948 RepID=A0ABY5MXW3_9SPHN|nr:2-dehydro-3-deoxy-6-phosphogalactonate aldolase [Sphingomonas glaciei]UUR09283.1 2-dehydro-3-deoxy-6-phosphogalactonate aldolase [Sphingomonas glaciei]